MDVKRINSTSEEMTNLDVSKAPHMSIAIDTGLTTQAIPPLPVNNCAQPPVEPIVRITHRGPTPSYEEAIDPNAPPPLYESLFGHMKDAQKSIFDFLQNILILFLGTIGYTILFSMTMIIPLCMMIIGGIYLYDCPQGEYIPVYLLVGGSFGVLRKLLLICAKLNYLLITYVQMLLDCFAVGWFIIGSIWVYKEYEPNYDPNLGKYCNKILYLSAFWLVTLTYILLAIQIVWICGISTLKVCVVVFNL